MRKNNICTHNPLQLSTTLGHKMSLPGVHLTTGQSAQCRMTFGHEMSVWGVHLTTGQSDPRADQMSS